MKLSCDIVQDLLPLYEEDLCSPGSRAAVEEHLRGCPGCRTQVEQMRKIPAPGTPTPASGEDRAAARSLRKVRHRWWVSLAAVLLVIPMLLMTVNQIRGQGLCFTNLDEAARVALYLNRVRSGDPEAADMLDYEAMYNDILEALSYGEEEYGRSFVPVVIDGETWYATEWFRDEYLSQPSDDLWAQLVYNRVYGIMVPEEMFERVAALEPENWEVTDGFVPLQTPWGVYYVDQSVYRGVYPEAVDYCYGFELIPEQTYLESRKTLLANAQREYDSTWESYGEVADMTLEEFTEVVRADFLRRQEGVPEWRAAGFSDAYYVADNGVWIIEWNLKYGGSLFQVEFRVRDGVLTKVASSAPDWEPEMDEIINSLDIHWPK